VLWRKNKSGDIEIAVEHRPRYDDWTLPKGKVDPGENLPGTAMREIREETGFEIELGWLIGYTHYPVRKRTKVVYYWTAEAVNGFFEGNEDIDDEVDELRWLSPDKARKVMSYELDVDVLNAGLDLLELGADRRILLVRHAKALPKRGWAGDDNLRPLEKMGRRQSKMLVSALSGYCPRSLVSAAPDRCAQTVTPLSQALGLPFAVDSAFNDGDATRDTDAAITALHRVAASSPVNVIVSQGAAIPAILDALSQNNGFSIEDMRVKKSSAWVLHFKGEELLGVDYLASPLAVK